MSIEKFHTRHIGLREHELEKMLNTIGVSSLEELMEQTVPQAIRLKKPLQLAEGISEYEYYIKVKEIASKNKIFKNFIGMGYYDTVLPAVIMRNVLENPSWYTSYTPYQAEISQGRLEALLNFQTMVMDLTGMELANASLLDEATAAAEAMLMMFNARPRAMAKSGANVILVDKNIFPQTLAVLKTRAIPLSINLQVLDYKDFTFTEKVFGAILQYPAADGKIRDYQSTVQAAHQGKALITVIADLMSLSLLVPPGEWEADVVVGSTQRFGIPMGFGGPHAAYFATREKFKRNVPGRIIGVSKDVKGNNALRMALQTREQHIKRERATSNICTAQALLAIMAGMYAVFHGAEGLRRIAQDIHNSAAYISQKLKRLGYKQKNKNFFDTLKIRVPKWISISDIERLALKNKINFNYINQRNIGISTSETTLPGDVETIVNIFVEAAGKKPRKLKKLKNKLHFDAQFERKSDYLNLDVFKRYHSETEMMRYIKRMEHKDISLTDSMISLGSCTMKLNSATSMLPLSFAEFGKIHPFVPKKQAAGYHQLVEELSNDLSAITGFPAISFQPNSGAAGEYTGLMVIQAYHHDHEQGHRNVVLIPTSAHGTNPASAVMAGMKIVLVNCDERGNIDLNDLRQKADLHRDMLSAFMVTYPSTHGVFESKIKEMCEVIHQNGGLVYMDGANMNAQVGLSNPATIGADVCHLNLHKTFGIPHGGGGPGVGPIAVSKQLACYLPTHPVVKTGGKKGISAVAAAPYGSASVLAITHAYIKMLGLEGLKKSTEMAILNANYLAARLKDYYTILYTGETGHVAHEMILDCRPFKPESQITETDIAKRLIDYGYHAPTLSFPVHGTLMVEPTESESLQELDRFVEVMKSIYAEIQEVKNGDADTTDNVLKNAPHTAQDVTAENWEHGYSRKKAAFPLNYLNNNKFWSPLNRIDNAFGDRNLMCSCKPIETY